MKKLKIVKSVFASFAMLLAMTAFTACSNSDDDDKESGNVASKSQTKEPEETKTPASETGTYDDSALTEATLWVVGDSTVCDYTKEDGSLTDATYFYPRYGYATQLENFLSSKITVRNLAISGRSSKSFLLEDNYTTLKNGIKSGDFLIVGFGHNDEKSDDAERFASASESTGTEGSFKYNLYNYYAKLALDKGATPILCSPIVRYSSTDDYTSDKAHVTANGNYGQAVVELGSEKNIQVIDLTALTKELYIKLGHDEAKYFHAVTSGSSDTEPNFDTIDGTHINIYGAKMVSCLIAKTIKESSCALKPYIKSTAEPTRSADLVKNPAYVYVEYTVVDWTNYTPVEQFTTTASGWYGTAFGDLGGDPLSSINGYTAKESEGVFTVGTAKKKGKIQTTADGIALCVKAVPVSENFTVSVKAKVSAETTLSAADLATGGFGLMLRDDCYTPVKDASTGKANYVAAGLYANSATEAIANFSRESGLLVKTNNTISEMYKAGDTVAFTISRTGQVVKVTTVYKNQTYENTYTDFDFVAKDNAYMYVGMFATRGSMVEFTEVSYEKTGESQGA